MVAISLLLIGKLRKAFVLTKRIEAFVFDTYFILQAM